MNEANDFLIGSRLALENSKQLIECGDALASIAHYGPANSLMILAIEECVKGGFLFYFKLVEDEINDKDEVLSILRDHRNKHYFGFITKLMLDAACMSMTDEELQHRAEKYFEGTDKSDDAAVLVQFEKFIAEISAEIMINVQPQLSNHNGQIGNQEWWRAANMMRNRGFYTDFEKSTWVIPQLLTKDDFNKTRQIAITLLSEMRQYNIKGPESLLFLRKIISAVTVNQGGSLKIPDGL